MGSREPNTIGKDHTAAIIGGAVAIFALLVVLAIGLEATDSPNTMLIIPVLGTTIGAGIVLQLFSLNKNTQAVKEAATVAVEAKAVAEDTNVRTQDIQHSLNGNLSAKFAEVNVKLASIDSRLTNLEGTIDPRIRSGVTAVLLDREAERDQRIREIVDEELNSTAVACRVMLEPEDAPRERKDKQ